MVAPTVTLNVDDFLPLLHYISMPQGSVATDQQAAPSNLFEGFIPLHAHDPRKHTMSCP